MALVSIAHQFTRGVKARSWVWVEIKPLSIADGAVDPGRASLDPSGRTTWLHVKYTGNITPITRSSSNPSAIDYVAPQTIIEFDSPTIFQVPFDGSIQLVGGAGEYKWYVYQNEERGCEAPPFNEYTPTEKYLRIQLGESANFTIPDNHTFLRGTGSNFPVTYMDPVLAPVVLTPDTTWPGTMVAPGAAFKNGFKPQTVVTSCIA